MSYLKKTLFSLMSLCLWSGLLAQNNTANRFQKTIGGSSGDLSYDIENTLDRGFILCGATSSYGSGNADMFLIKTDGNGGIQWQKTYGSSGDETAWGVLAASDSGFIVVGASNSYGNNKGDAIVFKTDKNGNLSWTTAIGRDSTEEAYAAIQSRSGSIYVTGWAVTDTFGSDLFIAKLTANGSLSWFKTFGDRGNEEGFAIFQDSRGDLVAAGYTDWDSVTNGNANGNPNDRDVFVVKTDTNGNVKWQKNYGGDQADEAWGISEYRGEYYLTGFTESFGAIGKDIFLMQIDQAGNHKNTFSLQDFEDERAFDIKLIPGTANFSVSGYQQRIGFSERNVVLLEINSSGNVLNYEIIGGSDRDGHWPTEAVRTPDEGYAILSTERSFHSGSDDNLFLTKTNSKGSAACNSRSSLSIAQPVQVYDSSIQTYRTRTGSSKPTLRVNNFTPATDSTICCELNAITASDSISICIGSSASIGGTAISGLTYQWTAGGSSFTSTAANPLVRPDSSTTYRLVVSSSNSSCKSDTAFIKVHVKKAIPSQDLIQDTSFCEGGSFTLSTYSGQSFYQWRGNTVSGSNSSVNLSTTDTVAVYLIDNLGCQYRDTAIVTANPLPVFSLGKDTTICANETIELIGPMNNIAVYNWNNGQANGQTFVTGDEQAHTLMVTDSNGCSWSDTLSIFNNPVSTFSLGPDTGFCAGSTYTIIGPGFLADFQWNDTASSSPNLNIQQAGTYWLSAANSFGCRYADTISLVEFALPMLDLGADTGYCSGNQLILKSPLNGSYEWMGNPARDEDTLWVSGAGTYFLHFTDQNGCSDIDSIEVSLYPNPSINLGADTIICIGDTLTLDAGSGYASYLWSDNSNGQTLKVFAKGTYNVLVTSNQGCEGFDEIVVDTTTCTNSMDQLQLSGLKIYPVPAMEILHIEWPSADQQLSITLLDLSGKVLLDKSIEAGNNSSILSVEDLKAGIYVLRVQQGDRLAQIKVLKSNR